jgi:hypothetical protein
MCDFRRGMSVAVKSINRAGKKDESINAYAVMERSSRLTSLAILIGFLPWLAGGSVQAGSSKKARNSAGVDAFEHMSKRAFENANAQWSADPEKGWIRAEERKNAHEKRQSTGKFKNNSGKHKGHTENDNVKNGSTKRVVN